ncbi:MAG: Y-family DNA polymerase [Phycisphaerales bacterium]|nr:Y-family DNA polymerase [Phycisphaerales bacterium]
MYALVDCNNFYASCERVFQPELEGRPVIVLSNNDGCVVARSQEAKDVGIGMGEPLFKCRERIRRHRIAVRSSNYALYEDMSRRVVQTIMRFIPDLEIYSIDEVFLDLDPLAGRDLETLCRTARATVRRWTGIPVSVGLGPTRTLAKLANRIAKRSPDADGVCTFPTDETHRTRVLESVAIEDVWGIGRRWAKRLHRIGIHTALDMSRAPATEIRRNFNIVAMHTALELRGVPCGELETDPPLRQTLVRSRSFGSMVSEWDDLSEAIASHAIRAAEKLRHENARAGHLTVFIHTNRFRDELPQYSGSGGCELLPPTSTTPVILARALAIGRRLWRAGFQYKKAGVMLSEITRGPTQGGLFEQRDERRDDRLMNTMDRINLKMGSGTLRPAASSFTPRRWTMNQDHRSPRFTTRWDELPRTR